jgi:hypothetical protein
MINNDQDSSSEQTERPFINGDRPVLPIPQRHGFVTGWLRFMMIMSSIGFLSYLFFIDKLEQTLHTSFIVIIILMVFVVCNGVSAFMLLSWKKTGFFLYVVTTIAFFITYAQIGIKPIVCISNLCSAPILYSILQIKKGGRSAWYYLK